MATKRPLCMYDGVIKELGVTDYTPHILPCWKLIAGESILVGERQEYAINSGTLINGGSISLGEDAILFIGGA